MFVIEKFVDSNSDEYEKCRIQVSNSTVQQLRSRLACLVSDLYIYANRRTPFHETFCSTAEWLWPITGKIQNK